MPYPVRQGPPGGHTPAEVTEDPEHNHARLQAAGASLWEKKYSVGSGNHVYGAPGTRVAAQGCEPGPGGTPVVGSGRHRLAGLQRGSWEPSPFPKRPHANPTGPIGAPSSCHWVDQGPWQPQPRAASSLATFLTRVSVHAGQGDTGWPASRGHAVQMAALPGCMPSPLP